MNAVIYAAGRATRLGPAYSHNAKILLKFGGRSLLEWHACHLLALGIRDITVVTGYRREQVALEASDIERRHGVAVRERYNPDFGEGSVISMLMSVPDLERGEDGVLIMDGDVLYHRSVLERLVGSPQSTVLLMDRGVGGEDEDPVLVPLRAGRPFEFAKKWRGTADVVGESVGFFKVSAEDRPLLLRETRKRATGLARLESYDEIIRDLVKADRFGCEEVSGLPWTEIDFPYDIEYAREKVLPALMAVECLPAGKEASFVRRKGVLPGRL